MPPHFAVDTPTPCRQRCCALACFIVAADAELAACRALRHAAAAAAIRADAGATPLMPPSALRLLRRRAPSLRYVCCARLMPLFYFTLRHAMMMPPCRRALLAFCRCRALLLRVFREHAAVARFIALPRLLSLRCQLRDACSD